MKFLCLTCWDLLPSKEALTIGIMGPVNCSVCQSYCSKQWRDFRAVSDQQRDTAMTIMRGRSWFTPDWSKAFRISAKDIKDLD